MKQKITTWLSKKNWAYGFSKRIIANKIIRGNNKLTPKYLIDKNWIEEDGIYYEPNIKGRDMVGIQFNEHYYRVFHSDKKTFITTESSVEWFEMYMLLIHSDNGIYELAGI